MLNLNVVTACTSPEAFEHTFRPISRFPDGLLDDTYQNVVQWASTHQHTPDTLPAVNLKGGQLLRLAASPFREIPTISRAERDVFRFLWPRTPVRISYSVLPGDWSPDRFSATHGREVVSVLASTAGDTADKKSTMMFSEFLQAFVSADNHGSLKLKVSISIFYKIGNESALGLPAFCRVSGQICRDRKSVV